MGMQRYAAQQGAAQGMMNPQGMMTQGMPIQQMQGGIGLSPDYISQLRKMSMPGGGGSFGGISPDILAAQDQIAKLRQQMAQIDPRGDPSSPNYSRTHPRTGIIGR